MTLISRLDDETVIFIKSIHILFYNKTDHFDQSSKYLAVPDFGALKGFSDSLANLEIHWKTPLEEVTRRIAKGLGGMRLGIKGGHQWEETTSSLTSSVRFGQMVSLKCILYYKRWV